MCSMTISLGLGKPSYQAARSSCQHREVKKVTATILFGVGCAAPRGGKFLTCRMRPQAQQDAILLPRLKALHPPCRTGMAVSPFQSLSFDRRVYGRICSVGLRPANRAVARCIAMVIIDGAGGVIDGESGRPAGIWTTILAATCSTSQSTMSPRKKSRRCWKIQMASSGAGPQVC